MLQLAAVVTSFLIGLLRGGNPAGLTNPRLRWLPLAGLAVLCHVLALPTPLQLTLGTHAIAPWLYVGSLALVSAVAARNAATPGLALILAGVALNLLAMLANGLQMPVDAAALARLGTWERERQLLSQGIWLHFKPTGPETNLYWLGDWLFLGPPWPWPRVYSPGDFLTCAGGFWFVQHLMLRDRLPQPRNHHAQA